MKNYIGTNWSLTFDRDVGINKHQNKPIISNVIKIIHMIPFLWLFQQPTLLLQEQVKRQNKSRKTRD